MGARISLTPDIRATCPLRIPLRSLLPANLPGSGFDDAGTRMNGSPNPETSSGPLGNKSRNRALLS